jgi:hypothetical protein
MERKKRSGSGRAKKEIEHRLMGGTLGSGVEQTMASSKYGGLGGGLLIAAEIMVFFNNAVLVGTSL